MSFIGVIGGFVWVTLWKSQFSAFVNNSTFLIGQSLLLGLKMKKIMEGQNCCDLKLLGTKNEL